MKGFVKFLQNGEETNLPIWEVSMPKWLRRKHGRIIRRSLRRFGFQMNSFDRTEIIVGNGSGEGLSYRQALYTMRVGERVPWNEL